MSAVVLEPYLFFDRSCQEAMEFYRGVFGGDLTVQKRGEVEQDAPEELKGLVMHASLSGGEVNLMGSDHTEAGSGRQSRVSLSLSGTREDRLRKVFDGLSEGGTVEQPLKKEFWGDTFGMVTDRFGISWMMNIGQPGS